MDSSDDFFSQMTNAPPPAGASKSRPTIGGIGSANSSSTRSTTGTSVRARRGPPPPPGARPGATASASASTIASTSTSAKSRITTGRAVPPPKASLSSTSSRSNIGGIGKSTEPSSSTSNISSNRSNNNNNNMNMYGRSNPQSSSSTSSFYGTSATAATAKPTTATATTSSSSSSYYSSSSPTLSSSTTAPLPSSSSPMFSSTPAPAPASQQQQSQQQSQQTSYNTTTTTNDTTASSDWYTPQPQQPQAMNNTTSSYYGATTSSSAQTTGVVPTGSGQQPTTTTPASTNPMVHTWNPAVAPSQQPQQHQQQQPPQPQDLGGPMDTAAAPTNLWSGPMNTTSHKAATAPTSTSTTASSSYGAQPYDPTEFELDPPLLEEIGIHIPHILFKTRAVLLPFSRFHKNTPQSSINAKEIVADADLAGPLCFALLLGGELLLTGKLQFGYIYGFGVFGVLAMTLILNLMSPLEAVNVWTVASVLGYALLPVNVLAAIKVVSLGYLETFGRVLALGTIVWCTIASTRLLEQGCGMRDQRYLIGYPIALVYSAFVMITIF